MNASGRFEVKTEPINSHAKGSDGVQLNRMSIEKSFEGDLEGVSTGEMLTAMTPIKGSAGYVAIEQVRGELGGKTGSIVLQHFGVMSAGNERLILEVVPDSGTGELSNIRGQMSITNKEGEHLYDFEYHFGDTEE